MSRTPTVAIPLKIEQIVQDANAIIARIENPDKRVLAIGIEINQCYSEYLDDLLSSDLSVSNGITINLDGKTIHFKNPDDFSNWLAENIT